MRQTRNFWFIALVLLVLPAISSAQPRSPANDPGFLAAKAAFEKFDLAERRAIQRELIWVGDFKGAATGEFGPMTYAAVRKLEEVIRVPVSGIMTPSNRRALAAGANAAYKRLDFAVEADPTSKMRIGVPRSILSKRSVGPAGLSRWQNKDETITLDLVVGKLGDKLEALFERGTDASVQGRKITYKVLRPDFFVIAGETATGKFYRRLEQGSDGLLRGFSLGHAKTISFEWTTLTIVASFEATPTPNSATSALASSSAPASPRAMSTPPSRRVSAVSLGGGRYLTALAPISTCKSLAHAEGAIEINKREAALGLALLSAGPAVEGVPLAVDVEADALLLQRDAGGTLITAPAAISGVRVMTPLQAGGGGAALIDRSGRLLGLVVDEPKSGIQVAGIVPQLSYRQVPARDIAGFAELAPSPTPGEPMAMNAIAARLAPRILSVICRE
ncbi:Peptidoglycan binding-like [Rhabdaerophilaceae bacterium]